MNILKETANKKVIILTLIIFAFSLSVFPRISNNGSATGYDEGDGGDSTTSINSTIESYIIDGGGYYLQGDSYIRSLLALVELQDVKGIDYMDVHRVVNGALENISNARITYEKLVKKAEVTPYNMAVIEQLREFDYKTFMMQNRLNETVCKEVAGYLSNGDITGILKRNLVSIKTIEGLLIMIKGELDSNRLAVLEIFWRLNELCAETSLFGSFVARVFDEIRK